MRMDTEKKLAVLKRIAEAFNARRLTWALGASMLLYFKGIAPKFHDIDLMVTNEDAPAAREILAQMGSLLPSGDNAGFRTRLFLQFCIDGVEVDLMAGFAIQCGDQVHDCSLQPDQIREFHDLMGQRIPLQDLTCWLQYYEWMGRRDKAAAIRAHLKC